MNWETDPRTVIPVAGSADGQHEGLVPLLIEHLVDDMGKAAGGVLSKSGFRRFAVAISKPLSDAAHVSAGFGVFR